MGQDPSKEGLAEIRKGLGVSLLLSPTKCSGQQVDGWMDEKRGSYVAIESSCRSILSHLKDFGCFPVSLWKYLPLYNGRLMKVSFVDRGVRRFSQGRRNRTPQVRNPKDSWRIHSQQELQVSPRVWRSVTPNSLWVGRWVHTSGSVLRSVINKAWVMLTKQDWQPANILWHGKPRFRETWLHVGTGEIKHLSSKTCYVT